MSFPRYPAYKDSGVEWLGKVPAHWDVKRLKQVFRERNERSEDGQETLLSVSAYTGVTPRSELIAEGDHLSRADSLEGYKVCHPSDLVVNIMLAWNRGLGISNHHGIVSPAYCVYSIIDGSDPEFLDFLMRSDRQVLHFKAYSSGVIDSRLRIYPETFGSLHCCLPPPSEQSSIAAFLDRETAKIDALVAEQGKLIALLQEKRQAVISHAVTKGLDPDVPMKDSGVEWLREVPAHWSVGALGYLASVDSGSTPDRGTPSFWGGAIPWVKTGEIDFAPIHDTEECITELGLANCSAKVAAAGTLLMAMYGQGVTRGRVAILQVPAAYNQACAAIAFGPRIDVHFARYFFIAAYDFVRDTGNETSQMNLSVGVIRRFSITIPPLAEQARIVEQLDRQVTEVDALVSDAARAIDLLKERRAALISAAVTGQIDVRSADPTARPLSMDPCHEAG